MSALTRIRWWTPAGSEPSPYRRRTELLLPSMGRAIWSALEGVGQRRAARELLQHVGAVTARDPELARVLQEACTELLRRAESRR